MFKLVVVAVLAIVGVLEGALIYDVYLESNNLVHIILADQDMLFIKKIASYYTLPAILVISMYEVALAK